MAMSGACKQTRSALTARGETPAAFGRRCIPADCVAPPSHIPDMLGRRALSSGRLAALGATLDLHHGLPGSLPSHGAADEPGITGYVLAPGGIPVSGGTVVSVSSIAPASTPIDRIGRFRVPVDRAGLYRVTVS